MVIIFCKLQALSWFTLDCLTLFMIITKMLRYYKGKHFFLSNLNLKYLLYLLLMYFILIIYGLVVKYRQQNLLLPNM